MKLTYDIHCHTHTYIPGCSRGRLVDGDSVCGENDFSPCSDDKSAGVELHGVMFSIPSYEVSLGAIWFSNTCSLWLEDILTSPFFGEGADAAVFLGLSRAVLPPCDCSPAPLLFFGGTVFAPDSFMVDIIPPSVQDMPSWVVSGLADDAVRLW